MRRMCSQFSSAKLHPTAAFSLLPLTALFQKSERLVRASVQIAASKQDELLMRGNLGEILRNNGDLEAAEVVSRAVLEEGGSAPNPQVCVVCGGG